MNASILTANREREVRVQNGWLMLPLLIGFLLGDIALCIYSIAAAARIGEPPIWSLLVASLLLLPVAIILLTGFFTLQPNEARVLILFGAKKLPELAKGLGQGIKEFKKATREVSDEIHTAMDETPAPPQGKLPVNSVQPRTDQPVAQSPNTPKT